MKFLISLLLFVSVNTPTLFAGDTLLSRTRSLMGTYVTISLEDKYNQEISASFDLVQAIENSLSTYDPNATLAKLNRTHTVPFDDYLAEAITLSKNIFIFYPCSS